MADLPCHGFEGSVGSVGGFRSLKEVFGYPRRRLWVARPAVRRVSSSADRSVCSHHMNHRRGKYHEVSPLGPQIVNLDGEHRLSVRVVSAKDRPSRCGGEVALRAAASAADPGRLGHAVGGSDLN